MLIFERKSSKTLKEIDNSEFMLLHWEKTYVLSLGMPPFIGSNCIILWKKGLHCDF